MPLDRRKFFSMTATLGTLALTPFEELMASRPAFKTPADFSIKIMGTGWGFNGTVDEFCAKAKKAGYDGIEMWWPGTPAAQIRCNQCQKQTGRPIGKPCSGIEMLFL